MTNTIPKHPPVKCPIAPLESTPHPSSPMLTSSQRNPLKPVTPLLSHLSGKFTLALIGDSATQVTPIPSRTTIAPSVISKNTLPTAIFNKSPSSSPRTLTLHHHSKSHYKDQQPLHRFPPPWHYMNWMPTNCSNCLKKTTVQMKL